MRITAIVCTYRRPQILREALNSLAAQTVHQSVDWEVLVVDNNSLDKTREVVDDFCRRYPGRFRYLFEARQGLSYARNCAVREAKGDILSFIDDDVTVETGWLGNLTAKLYESPWTGAGGRILPQQGFAPPDWLTIGGQFDLGGSLVLFDLGDEAGELLRPPFGANMAFRKQMFEKYGGFRTDLGRCGSTSLIGNEDTEFCQRLMAAGERFWYAPSAVVCHPVTEERLKKSYLRAWWYSYGRAGIRQTGSQLSLHEIPNVYARRLKGLLRDMFQVNPHWPLYSSSRFYGETQLCIAAGEIVEILWPARQGAEAQQPTGPDVAIKPLRERDGPSEQVARTRFL